MPPLIYHRSFLNAVAHPNLIRITNLHRCKLRLINMNDDNDACLMSCMIVKKNQPIATVETISIFFRQQSIGAAFDVGWEGDIELGADQDLVCLFEDAVGVAPTAGDDLYVTVGYESLW